MYLNGLIECSDVTNPESGGQRMIKILLYLTLTYFKIEFINIYEGKS